MKLIEFSFIIINVLFAACCMFMNLASFSLSQSSPTLNCPQKLYSTAQIIQLLNKTGGREQKTIAVKG